MDDRIQRGFDISPVAVTAGQRERALVGLGSYIVNAQAACSDCHSCPSYTPDHSPYQGKDGQVNAQSFMSGGTPFGPSLKAPNLTPDAKGMPGGLSYGQFEAAMKLGHDPDAPAKILQVMPWPIYRTMQDRDLQAIYAYLSSIPHAEPGHCAGPGE